MNWSSHNIDPYLDPEGHHGSVEYPSQVWTGSVDDPFLTLPTGQSVPSIVLSPYTHFAHLSSAPFEWNMVPPLPPIDSSPSDTTWAIDAPTVESGTTDEGANDTELSNMSYGSTGNGHSTNSSPSTPMMEEPGRSVTASYKPAKGKASHGRCPTYRTQTTADHTRELICKWSGCNYSGRFRRPAELMRHIQTRHILPGSFKCSKRDCNVKFNRRDNLKDHVRRIH